MTTPSFSAYKTYVICTYLKHEKLRGPLTKTFTPKLVLEPLLIGMKEKENV